MNSFPSSSSSSSSYNHDEICHTIVSKHAYFRCLLVDDEQLRNKAVDAIVYDIKQRIKQILHERKIKSKDKSYGKHQVVISL